MRTAPEDLSDHEVVVALSREWGLRVTKAAYVPVGGGSHHWIAVDDAGRRWWVNVDELDRRGYLGDTIESAFDGLHGALDLVLALHQGGLEFVVAPTPALAGEVVRRLGARHSIAVFPYVEGTAHRFADRLTSAERAELVDMLGRLHRATPVASVRRAPLELPERSSLEEALGEVEREWGGGPLSEPARALAAAGAGKIRELLGTFDALAAQVAGAPLVVTHGEPHPGNLIGANGRLLLVDWDTVGLAPPERDLWMVDRDRGDEAAIRLYRLRWRLDDISLFLKALRSAHHLSADTEHALRSLARSIEDYADPG